MKTEVVVVGGGSAGLAAAIASARAGADTLLIERGGTLGGMATAALVHTMCGLFRIHDGPDPVWANPGFPREFAERLQKTGAAGKPIRMGRVDVLPHDPVAFAALADTMAAECPRLRIWMHSELVAVHGKIEAVDVLCRGEHKSVTAKTWIDATGDASLTAMAGAAFEQMASHQLQRPAYVARLHGAPSGFFDEAGRLRIAHGIARAVKDGQLPAEALGAGFRAGVNENTAFVTVDLEAGQGGWDPASPDALAGVEITGRRTVLALIEFLRSNAPELAVVAWPARAGVRESRRATGVYELTGDDVLQCAQFPDAIAAVAWPMELRERATGPRFRFPEAPLTAQIPLRSLRHRDVKNLWIAGRCISATHEAQASIRVMGTCMATGEAAGRAAAFGGSGNEDWLALASRVNQLSE